MPGADGGQGASDPLGLELQTDHCELPCGGQKLKYVWLNKIDCE